MSNNLGKKFEAKMRDDWAKSTNNSFLLRLYDTTNGFANITNVCDYIGFANGKLFLIECKSHDGASIPFTAISQFNKLLNYKDFKNVFPGVVVWFKDKNHVLWLPVKTLEREYQLGKKSINYKIYEDPLSGAIDLPSTLRRTFMDTDYSPLLNL